jgi:glycosyltransferase involved in cell wall biosynthesis
MDKKILSINNLPFVSIIIPCRNEEKFIGKCLDSIIANDYTKEKLEVLVVDGMSEDKTRQVLGRYTEQYPFICLLDNYKRITPVAMNIGIEQAKGEIIMKMDAHTYYEKDYISNCVKFLQQYNADNVGGVIKIIPRRDTLMGRAIATALSHRFGVGNSYFRIGVKEPTWTDTVAFGCYKREVFDKIGLYNEDLARGQDMEFNLRLNKSGGRTLLVPQIVCNYYCISNFTEFFQYNFKNGFWAIYPFKSVRHMPVSLRHLVPLIFVLSLLGSLGLAIFYSFFGWLFLSIAGVYFLTNIYFSCQIALREKNTRYLFVMPIVFANLHINYGLGSGYGLMKVLVSKEFWKRWL